MSSVETWEILEVAVTAVQGKSEQHITLCITYLQDTHYSSKFQNNLPQSNIIDKKCLKVGGCLQISLKTVKELSFL